jgi:nucleoside-diphosphate-sugar epimerase
MHRADFCKSEAFHPAGDLNNNSVWISFRPIWLLAPFFEQLALRHPERLEYLSGLVASSSSSALTKRFASNPFDRELAARLTSAEDRLLSVCHRLGVECRILRPTIIYGQIGPYDDRNFSRLLQILRRVPLFPVPSDSGLRQPIHASQLSAVALHIARQLAGPGLDPDLPERIALGGDTSLNYESMIRALQTAQPASDPAQRCRLLPIPNRFFFSLAAPMLLHSTKAFEAVIRISANLAGFTPAHQLLGTEPQPLPVLPLS